MSIEGSKSKMPCSRFAVAMGVRDKQNELVCNVSDLMTGRAMV